MRVTLATEPGSPDRPNEDFVAAAPGTAVLLDGGTTYPIGADTGCVHGVAWYARTLGTTLLAEIVAEPRSPLEAALAEAIGQVRDRHQHTCDLTNALTPAATVVAVRASGDSIEYLVLSDSALVIDRDDGHPAVITLKTRPAASTDPRVAGSARIGHVSPGGLRGLALLSDGVTRIVERYGVLTWAQAIAIARDDGPGELIRQVRAAEATDPDRTRWPRRKSGDDASVLYWHC